MQATRGTSLTSTDPGQARRSGASTHRMVFAVVAITAYAVDLFSKLLAVHRLSQGDPVDVVGSWLRLDLVRNPGAAFSAGTSYTLLLSVIAVIAAATVIRYGRRLGDRTWAVALGLLLAGVCGNLTDRVFREPGFLRGHVVDFLELPHWPVFNVADMCIDVAAVLILFQAFRNVRLDGSRPEATRIS
jgi:signal peptidase II